MSARRTLARPTSVFRGVGLHSGADASVRVLPAAPGAGVVFRDAEAGQEIPASCGNVVDTARCTVLGRGDFQLKTVEHLLSALAGLGVDDALVETTGGELPAADGSAAPFAALLREAGFQTHDGPGAAPIAPGRPLLLTGEGGASLLVLPSDRFQATVVLDYPQYPYLGTQAFTYDSACDDYEAQVAPARTFGFLHEIEWLRARGLGLGASYDNAVVLREDGYDSPLRFPDELARHKLLDLIGDLALTGRPVQAQVIAVKPGHALNTHLARRLVQEETPGLEGRHS